MDVESMKSIIREHTEEIFDFVTQFRNNLNQINFAQFLVIKENLKNLIIESDKQLEDVNMELSEDEKKFIVQKKEKLEKVLNAQLTYTFDHGKMVDALKNFLSALVTFNVSFLEFKTSFSS
jgi:uncharacterized protein YlzI (FlbEa/FlbD family)